MSPPSDSDSHAERGNSDDRRTQTQNQHVDKQFAEPYTEQYEEISADEITKSTFEYATVDITYETHSGNTKTVRASQATEPYDGSDLPDGCVSFYDLKSGDEYAFQLSETRLISRNKGSQNRTVATAEDVTQFNRVVYPDSVPVVGGVEEDVEATIYYRSKITGTIQTMRIVVERVEGEIAYRISGTEVNGDRRIEAYTSNEREMRKTRSDTSLGKVARVEFPKGHQFTVQLEGLTTKLAEDAPGRLKALIENEYNRYRRDNEKISVSVTHEGQTSYDSTLTTTGGGGD